MTDLAKLFNDNLIVPSAGDPRYQENAIRHPIDPGIFAGIEPLRVFDGEFYDDAEFAWAYKTGNLRMSMEWLDMREIWAVQDYWCEQNIQRLERLPANRRQAPAVFRFQGRDFLMDGTHRALLSLIETHCAIIECRVYTLKVRGRR